MSDPDAAAPETPRARVESWILGGFLVGAFLLAFVTTSYPIQKNAMSLALLAVLVVYPLEAARAAWPGRRFLRVPGLVWGNLGLFVALAVLNLLYDVSNQPIGTVHSVKTDIDTHTPVIPVFTIPYLGFYIVYVWSLGWFAFHRLDRQLRTAVGAFSVSAAVGLVTFVIFQTYVTPPTIDGTGPFWHLLQYVVDDVYAREFYSAFPSLHCAFSTIIGIMWVRAARERERPGWSALAVVFAVAVIAATQFLHMHYVMDAIYGVFLAFGSYAVSWWVFESRRARSAQGTSAPEPARHD